MAPAETTITATNGSMAMGISKQIAFDVRDAFGDVGNYTTDLVLRFEMTNGMPQWGVTAVPWGGSWARGRVGWARWAANGWAGCAGERGGWVG